VVQRTRYFKLGVQAGDKYLDEFSRIDEVDDILTFTGSKWELVAPTVAAKGRRTPPDRLFVVGSDPLLLSDAAYARIAPLRLCPAIEWHSVNVKWRQTLHPYRVGDSIKAYDIWDYQRSEYSLLHDDRPRSPHNVGFMNRGVAIESLFPPLDLFRARFLSWVGSEAFRDLWQANRCTGTEFIELDIAN
jgi:hypothetical protein